MKSGMSPARHVLRKGLGKFAPLIALGVLALGAWLAGSSAAPPVSPPEPAAAVTLWSQLDTNGDGRISAAEGAASAEFKANFEMMDVDRDGFVSQSEYRSAPASLKLREQRQQRRDDMGEEEEEERRRR